jgi:hypothetical protein
MLWEEGSERVAEMNARTRDGPVHVAPASLTMPSRRRGAAAVKARRPFRAYPPSQRATRVTRARIA